MEEADGPVWNSIHRSLVRPDLVAGCERGPLVLSVALAFAFVIIFQKPFFIIVGILIIVLGFPFLRWMAKQDPFMYRILIRHYIYKDYYPAHPGLNRPSPRAGISPGSIIQHQRKKGSTE